MFGGWECNSIQQQQQQQRLQWRHFRAGSSYPMLRLYHHSIHSQDPVRCSSFFLYFCLGAIALADNVASLSWFASLFPSLCICLFWRLEGDLLIREKSLSGDGIIPIWYRNMIQNTEYGIIPIWFRNLPKEERIHGFMDPGEGEANKEPSPRKALRINDLMPRARGRARGRGRGRARGRDRFCCNRPVEMLRHLYRKCPPYFMITKW